MIRSSVLDSLRMSHQKGTTWGANKRCQVKLLRSMRHQRMSMETEIQDKVRKVDEHVDAVK